MRAHIAAVLGATLLGTSLVAGCSDDEDTLSRDDLAGALLVVDDLGADFAIAADEDDDDDDSPAWGCLLEFSELPEGSGGSGGSGDEDEDDIEVALEAKVEPGMPGVFQVIDRADDSDEAEAMLDTIYDAIDGCHSVNAEDDGTLWRFEVEHDRVAWAAGVDQQVNLSANGTASIGSIELPISISLSVVRIDEVISMMMFFDMASDIDAARRDLLDVAVERIEAVLAGKDQPEPAGVLEDYPIGAEYADLLGGSDV